MVSKPSYDPNRLAVARHAAVARQRTELLDDDEPPAGQPRDRRPSVPAGLGLQARHGRGRAVESGSTPRTPCCPGPAELDLPQTDVGLPNFGGGGLRQQRPGHAHRRAAHLLQHRLRLPRHGARWRRASREQAEPFGFGQELRVPAPGDAELGAGRAERAADRAGRHRPVRRAGDPAAGRDGQRGRRQRRRGDAPQPGRRGAWPPTCDVIDTRQPQSARPGCVARDRRRRSTG